MKNIDIETITSVREVFSGNLKTITIVPHENPDGDAIGSAIGLGEILKKFGHSVNIISTNDYPEFLKWFKTGIKITIYDSKKKVAKRILRESDVLVCVDFNASNRVGHLEKQILKFEKTKILIDHHPFPTYFCDFTISDTSYSSTAELIFDVVQSIGLENNITTNAAEALYTGILTDTGSFSHNFSKNTFKVVSHLLEKGINTDKVKSNVYDNYSESRMKLLGYCLNEKMEVFPELRSAMITISKQELEDYNFEPGDTEGFVNYPLSIGNIVFSALFIEKDGVVKASFRSKGNFPANEFSKNHFDGGGHLNAAGGESKLNLFETIEKFKQLLPEYKHQLLETII